MTDTTDLQKLLAEVQPDYGYVQAVLTANLIRRGVIDQIIPREEMPEWAKVLADVACKPLAARVLELEAENKRLRDGLDEIIRTAIANVPEIKSPADQYEEGFSDAFDRAADIARTALKGGEI